jgi:hypothetical protein
MSNPGTPLDVQQILRQSAHTIADPLAVVQAFEPPRMRFPGLVRPVGQHRERSRGGSCVSGRRLGTTVGRMEGATGSCAWGVLAKAGRPRGVGPGRQNDPQWSALDRLHRCTEARLRYAESAAYPITRVGFALPSTLTRMQD